MSRSRLADIVGPAAGRLHTARSRNDQVAVDFRLWVRDAIDALDGQMAELQRALSDARARMRRHGHARLHPSAIGAARHLRPPSARLCRDARRATAGRFADARARLNECPLGAAALAGTSFPIDRHMTAEALGFDRPTANSLDSVADRDFALETLARGGDLRRRISRASPKRSCCGRRRSSASSGSPTPSRPAPRSCRRSATPTRPSWCAARRAASSARSSACSR